MFISCNLFVVVWKRSYTYSNTTKATTKQSSNYVGTCCHPKREQIESFIAIVRMIFCIIRRLINVIDPIVASYKPTEKKQIDDWVTTFVDGVLIIFIPFASFIIITAWSTRTHVREITDNKNRTSYDKVYRNLVFFWAFIFVFCPWQKMNNNNYTLIFISCHVDTASLNNKSGSGFWTISTGKIKPRKLKFRNYIIYCESLFF